MALAALRAVATAIRLAADAVRLACLTGAALTSLRLAGLARLTLLTSLTVDAVATVIHVNRIPLQCRDSLPKLLYVYSLCLKRCVLRDSRSVSKHSLFNSVVSHRQHSPILCRIPQRHG